MQLVERNRWLAWWLLFFAVGCGQGLVPVEGTVLLDGRPLAGATLTIQRDAPSPEERSFRAETDEAGHYQLRTADGRSTGALSGEYRVYITSVKPPAAMNEFTKLPPDRVPPQWRDGSQSFTVPDGGASEANFTLSSSTRR
jgi:hypothetical protein